MEVGRPLLHHGQRLAATGGATGEIAALGRGAVALFDQVDGGIAGFLQRIVGVVGQGFVVPGKGAGARRVGDVPGVAAEHRVATAERRGSIQRAGGDVAGDVRHRAVVTAAAEHHRLAVPLFRQHQAHADCRCGGIDRANLGADIAIGAESLRGAAAGGHRGRRRDAGAAGRQADGLGRDLAAEQFGAGRRLGGLTGQQRQGEGGQGQGTARKRVAGWMHH